ncbi:protein rIIB [Citromicrobium phage vB_CbaS-RXM]|nr:protein rIIB [Citromicrobium phage vB_CbaS-RXM]
MSLSFTIGASTITVFLDGQIHTVEESHVNYQPLLAELRKEPEDRNLDAIRPLVSIKKMIEAQTFGEVQITEDAVMYRGNRVARYMETRMLEVMQQGIGIEPWVYFIENLYKNPSQDAIAELYEWLEKARLPLTPDGCFIAFKKVRDSYMDCHTGKFENRIGNILEMPRDLCDPNRSNDCSRGFHFASVGYLKHFGGQRVMAVKINPRDVVSIPRDYHTTKGRCSRYTVVAELQSENAAANGAWAKKSVVDLEDPQEFPDLLVKQIIGTEDQPESEGKVITTAKNKKAGPAKPKREKKVSKKKVTKAEKTVDPQREFPTTTGGTYTAKQIIDAVKNSKSGREAARLLGVGESTLRGWKKVLGL